MVERGQGEKETKKREGWTTSAEEKTSHTREYAEAKTKQRNREVVDTQIGRLLVK